MKTEGKRRCKQRLNLFGHCVLCRHGGAYRSLKTLLQHKLVHHEGQKYDGYRWVGWTAAAAAAAAAAITKCTSAVV
jgi:hypothetical protein